MTQNAKFEVEIYGETTRFENSLKGVDTAMKGLKGEAAQLKRELVLDPTSTEKMAQLQKNLQQQLSVTKQKSAELRKELSGIDRSTPDGSDKFIRLSKQLKDSEVQAGFLEKEIGQVGNAIERGNWKLDVDTGNVNSKISKVKTSFNGLKEIAIGSMRQIGSSIVSNVSNKIGGLIGDTAKTQKSMIALKNTMDFSGNGKDFDSLSTRMKTLAKDTNANTSDTLKLATTFIGLGDSAQVAGDKVDSIVRANQAFGGTSEDLQSVTQAYGQMSASGKVTAENMNQLTDANTALGSALKKQISKDNPQLIAQYGTLATAQEKGAVSTGMLDQALGELGKAGGGGATTIDDAMASLSETISLALLPALNAITPTVTEIINMVADSIPSIVEHIKNIIQYLKENWDWISKIIIVLGTMLAAYLAIKAAVTIFSAISAAITFLLSPMGLVVLAVAGLIAAGIALWQNWDKVTKAILEMWQGVKDWFAGLGTWFSELWTSIVTTTQGLWTGLVNWFVGIIESIKSFFSGLGTWFSELWTGIVTMAQNIWTGLVNFFVQVFNWIKDIFSPLVAVFTSIMNLVKAVFNVAWQIIFGIIKTVYNGVVNIWNGITGFFSSIFNTVKGIVSNVFSAIGSFASSAWGVIVSVFSPIGSFFSGIFNTVRSVVSSVFAAVGNFASNARNRINSVFSSVGSFFSGIFNTVRNTVANTFNSIGDFAANAYNNITRIFGNIVGFFSGIFGKVADIANSVFGGIARTIDGITSAVNGVAGKIKGFFGGSVVEEVRTINFGGNLGMLQHSANNQTSNVSNVFHIQAGQMDITDLARALRREFNAGRA